MSPAVRGAVERRTVVNYRIDLGKLDAVLPGPFRGREVGESGKGIGSVCLAEIQKARPRFAPERVGVSVRSVTHRISAEMESDGGRRFCAYVPLRGVSSRLCAAIGRHTLPADLSLAEFRTEEKKGVRRIYADCDKEHVAIEERLSWVGGEAAEIAGVGGDVSEAGVSDGGAAVFEKAGKGGPEQDTESRGGTGEPEDVEEMEGSIFYSVESARVFLCEGGLEYMSSGDGRYKSIDPCPEEQVMEPISLLGAKSSYFEKLGGDLDSAFRMGDLEQEWKIGHSINEG